MIPDRVQRGGFIVRFWESGTATIKHSFFRGTKRLGPNQAAALRARLAMEPMDLWKEILKETWTA